MPERPPTRLGDVDLEEFQHPQLEPTGDTRTAEHQLLPTGPDDGGGTVTQHLGDEARTFRLRGDCYESTVSELDALRGETVSLRHSLWSGMVYVEAVDANSQGAKDATGWRYTYTIDLREVTE
jgi:hypothetical protein